MAQKKWESGWNKKWRDPNMLLNLEEKDLNIKDRLDSNYQAHRTRTGGSESRTSYYRARGDRNIAKHQAQQRYEDEQVAMFGTNEEKKKWFLKSLINPILSVIIIMGLVYLLLKFI